MIINRDYRNINVIPLPVFSDKYSSKLYKNNLTAQNKSAQTQSVKPMAGLSECAVPVSSNNQGYSSFGKL